MRGDGSLKKRGRIWWLKYRGFERSAKTANREEAEKKLQGLRRSVDRGDAVPAAERQVTVKELLDDLVTHLEVQKKASWKKVRSHLVQVRDELGGVRAIALDTATVERCQKRWLKDGRAPATINRRCEALRQAFNLARKRTPPKVRVVPYIPLLAVDNARQGFLSRADFLAVLKGIRKRDVDVADFLEWFFWTSQRPGEIRQLEWSHLDRETWQLHVPPALAKTRSGRTIAVQGPLKEILERRRKRKSIATRLIFHRVSKGTLARPIGRYDALWRTACAEAGLVAGRFNTGGLVPYDLRRTGLRNIVRATGSERAAMAYSGHKTRRTFDRYNIHSDEDQRGAMDATKAFVETLPTRRKLAKFKRR